MHPALQSWRDELPSSFVRVLAYLGAVAVLSIGAARVSQSPPVMNNITPAHQSEWVDIERPFPAFALSIPEAADVPASYGIRRHVEGGGRKDILALGEADDTTPYLQVEIYRPGGEISDFADAKAEIIDSAAALGPIELKRAAEPLASKFGPLTIVSFVTSKGTPRRCVGFVRPYSDPRLQIAGWFCQGGNEFIEQSTLACALDRLTLLSAGSEPKIGALFAQAELNRSFCGQRDPILAATPKYHLLWKALANRPQPRRIGR
ncbi:MAG TPA: hypothetical protein VEH78_02480 [Pseudolabrys sp.]|nr:hypothetical protein [Pseudolabrys sp.]